VRGALAGVSIYLTISESLPTRGSSTESEPNDDWDKITLRLRWVGRSSSESSILQDLRRLVPSSFLASSSANSLVLATSRCAPSDTWGRGYVSNER
jgi:hypothetical protein